MTAEIASARVDGTVRVAKRRNWLTNNLPAKLASIPMVLTALIVFVGGSIWSMVYSFTSSKLPSV